MSRKLAGAVMFVAVLLAILSVDLCPPELPPDGECPPGCYVSGDGCTACAPGSYNAHKDRSTSCERCDKCYSDRHEEEGKPCTPRSNTRCKCAAEYRRDRHGRCVHKTTTTTTSDGPTTKTTTASDRPTAKTTTAPASSTSCPTPSPTTPCPEVQTTKTTPSSVTTQDFDYEKCRKKCLDNETPNQPSTEVSHDSPPFVAGIFIGMFIGVAVVLLVCGAFGVVYREQASGRVS